jgi:hypothetical protein
MFIGAGEGSPEIAKIFDDNIINGSLVTPKTAGIESTYNLKDVNPHARGRKMERETSHRKYREQTYSKSNIT